MTAKAIVFCQSHETRGILTSFALTSMSLLPALVCVVDRRVVNHKRVKNSFFFTVKKDEEDHQGQHIFSTFLFLLVFLESLDDAKVV